MDSKQLTDNSPMPFGKYEGIPLIDVPDGYLKRLSEQEWIDEWPAVLDYIEDNMHVLDHEITHGRY